MARPVLAARDLTPDGQPAGLVYAQLCDSHLWRLLNEDGGAHLVHADEPDTDRPCDRCGMTEQHEQQREAYNGERSESI